ncbi:MAG: hypothetical protein ACRDD7_12590 [Peptostreptococcaceae bacterium]
MINKLKQKTIKKIIRILGIDLLKAEFENLEMKYNKICDYTYSNVKTNREDMETIADQIINLNSLYSIGVDVGVNQRNEHHNWAVICMNGKPEYVQFIDLNRGDVREVRDFLRRFEGSRRIVDAPFNYFDMFCDEGLLKKKH